VRKGSSILVVGSGGPGILSDVEEDERGGILKRYGRGLHSTRRTRTRQVPGFGFDDFLTGRGRGRCQPSLPSLVECHLVRLALVDLHLVGGKERLPDDVDPSTHKRRTFQEARKSTNMEGEHTTLTWFGWPIQQLWSGLA
jgi:hypothetical protein